MRPVTAGILVVLWCHQNVVLGKFCPNKVDKCPSVMTCCIIPDGTYGCCPYQDAQCCPDKIHCCPPGTKCNVSRQSCDSLSLNFPYRWMVAVYPKSLLEKNYASSNVEERDEDLTQEGLKCPDGRTCAADATCCKMPTRNFGCCLYSNATCCSDLEHCCPEGYECDLNHNRCVSKLSKTKELPRDIWNVPLFDLKTGAYEVMSPPLDCEPRPECEPKTPVIKCNPVGIRSHHSFATIGGEGKDDGKRIDHFDIICPDKTEVCPTASTCCELSSGGYGCCPMVKATCCPDKEYCCPNGYVCDENDCVRKPPLTFQDVSSTQWNRAFGRGP